MHGARRCVVASSTHPTSLTIHVCFLRETQFVGTNNTNMEEAGILEKIN